MKIIQKTNENMLTEFFQKIQPSEIITNPNIFDIDPSLA